MATAEWGTSKAAAAKRAALPAPVESAQPRGVRAFLKRTFDHHLFHATILLVVFLDVAAVLCEIMLRDVCPGAPAGSPGAQTVSDWSVGLAWTSRSLLFFLLIHQVLLLFAVGPHVFASHAGYVVDLLIVVVALVLEMTHLGLELAEEQREAAAAAAAGAHDDGHGGHGAHGEGTQYGGALHDDAGGLLIVLLAWRVVRIVHGFVVTAEAHADDSENKELRARVAELEAQLARVAQLQAADGKAGASLSQALARSGDAAAVEPGVPTAPAAPVRSPAIFAPVPR